MNFDLTKIEIPRDYDYVGVYLTEICHLKCPYCITNHHGASYILNHPWAPKGKQKMRLLTPQEWVKALNRLDLPQDVPVTLQGGEPFLYKGIWEILENLRHKADILTALPPNLTREHFLRLKTLDWNKRKSPYPTIRVSFHRGQNNFKDLVKRISKLNDILDIGLYYLGYPDLTAEEIQAMNDYAKEHGVELRKKEFLGEWKGEIYGDFLYKDAVVGKKLNKPVLCKNTVVPIAPDGTIYRCHSDLYFQRREAALGNILDQTFKFPRAHLPCDVYGLCSECDVKVKTNRYQKFGYTSVDIIFLEQEKAHGYQEAQSTHY